ncbi:uncharacterized protein Z520_02404 [Fonsecaea multimorphosa CBS 102226]|uniref:NmrA-like domain-containing protein n=1 Tax=Fonsecaea multimorphosa CBS 102226 TaxID=1442371 RepID=A0A0D2HK37_9EURO|nr:uncharacterized protein Z520_02404 [Fonsecaea multimorphosa CBS 102226]KIY02266.1 hypothetical protein Z520_02404 [Fonsecaea multimorphosa CBS 102226]OAL28914.1 hypothetical protein AYO22_02350 [Fonsecaea multimorphosa]
MAKLFVVVGATGGQGGSVIKSFLGNPEWKLRGLTRNPKSERARALAAQGVEMVAANLSDEKSVEAAFDGAAAIFAVTNFLETFPANTSEQCMEVEMNQAINMAKAAAKVSTLEHYIWSTLPNSEAISGKDWFIPHFCGKGRVDAYIKKELPSLYRKTTLLLIPLYGDNFQYPVVTPHLIKSTGKYAHLVPWNPDTPITLIGSHKDNTGVLAKAIIARGPRQLGGKYVLGDVETMTAEGMLEVWSKATNKESAFVQISLDDYEKLWPRFGTEMALMYLWWMHAGGNPWVPNGEELLRVKDLGLSEKDFVLTKDAILYHNWDELC